MASYEIVFKPSVGKDLRQLSRELVTRITEHIARLAEDPFPRQAVKLSGAERFYRVRVGDYRILYEVDTQMKQVTIHCVRHRREVYRSL